MTMIDIHLSAVSSKVASYHEFLLRYKKQSKVVYGFVEGKEDPCFYRGFIEMLLPEDWTVELWPAGNKNQIYRIHSYLDWRKFPKERICFFVDRDLADIIPEKLAKDSNIYVTNDYSIENDIVCKGVCHRILTELFGMSNVNHAEMEKICCIFEDELEKFLNYMIPVMGWILYWRRSGKRPNLSDISIKDLFSIQNGHLQMNPSPRGKGSVAHYIHGQCNVVLDPSVNISPYENEFRKNHNYRKFTRGKYVFWFLVEFCNTVHRDALTLLKSISKFPKKSVSLSSANGIAVVGMRARIPKSLREFINITFGSYVRKAELKIA